MQRKRVVILLEKFYVLPSLPSFFSVYLPSFGENWVYLPSITQFCRKLGILTQYLPSFEFSKLPSLRAAYTLRVGRDSFV